MTASYQTSLFTFALEQHDRQLAGIRSARARRRKWHSYQVVVTNFDLEEEILYIEALDPASAADEAALQYQGDIYNLCIYDVTGL